MAGSTNIHEPIAFDLSRLLVENFKNVPAWADLAQACNDVLIPSIENQRKKLATTRDSVKFRKGMILDKILYTGTGVVLNSDGDAVDASEAELTKGGKINVGRVTRIVQNNVYGKDSVGQDLMEIEFFVNGKQFKWLFPFSAPQERSILIQNAYLMGFDFFSSTLSDEDYQRLYEYVSLYWPEGGTDNFIRFMSFIKNIKLEGIPLWSYDDGTDGFPVLEERPDGTVIGRADKTGKVWYQTSHIELRYNPLENLDNLPVDENGTLITGSLSEIERLFFTFAPINLVLARITAAIDMYFDFFYAIMGQETEIYAAKYNYQYADMLGYTYLSAIANVIEHDFAKYSYKQPIMDALIKGSFITAVEDYELNVVKYQIPDLNGNIYIAASHQLESNFFAKDSYKQKVMDAVATAIVAMAFECYMTAYTSYQIPVLDSDSTLLVSSNYEDNQAGKLPYQIPVLSVDSFLAGLQASDSRLFYAHAIGVYNGELMDGDDKFPFIIINSFNGQSVQSYDNLIYGMVTRDKTDNYVGATSSISGGCSIIFQFSVRSSVAL